MRSRLLCVLAMTAMLPSLLRADDPLDWLLDEHVYAVARFDLETLDFQPLAQWTRERLDASGLATTDAGRRAQQAATDLARLNGVVAMLRSQGVREVYAVGSSRLLDLETPLLFATRVEGPAAERLAAQLAALNLASERAGPWMVVSRAESLRAMRDFRPQPRPDLLRLLRAVRGGSMVMVLRMGQDARRALDERLPPMDEITNAEVGALLGGFHAGTLAVAMPKDFALGLRIEATDDVSADTIDSHFDRIVREARLTEPAKAAWMQLLRPKRDGKVFTLELTTRSLDRVLAKVGEAG
jgi:hypothetical protein